MSSENLTELVRKRLEMVTLNIRTTRVLATVSLLLVATTGQKSYWSNYRDNDEGPPNGDSDNEPPNGWTMAQRPMASQQSREAESSQEDEPQQQTWTQGPRDGDSEMTTPENGWSNDDGGTQERYVQVQQGQDGQQEEEKVWVNQGRGQQTQDEGEKVWVRSRPSGQDDEEKVWVNSRGQASPQQEGRDQEERVWVRSRGQGNQDEEKVWVNRPSRVQHQQQVPDEDERVWVGNKPTSGRGQQVQEEKVWVRSQPPQEDGPNYEQERYYVQQQDDSSGPGPREKQQKEETPVYNDGPNTERHRYIVTQQPQSQQEEEPERPGVSYVTRNQWNVAQQQQSQPEEEIPVKLQQQRAKEQIYAHTQQRPTSKQIQKWQQQQQRLQQQVEDGNTESTSQQGAPPSFVYKTKSKGESSASWRQLRQPKTQQNSDSNDANPNNWPRARQMDTYTATEDTAEILLKKERILQLLQELQRLQLETLRESNAGSVKFQSSKGKGQKHYAAESGMQYWTDSQQNPMGQASENRPFQYRYGEDQVIPWSRLPRLTSKSDATPEIKRLAKVLAKEILGKQKETAGRHNHLHTRLTPIDYYSKLKYAQARGNKQGGVTITWSEPWSNMRGQNSVRPSYDAAQSLYKSSGSSPTWTAAQINKMYSSTGSPHYESVQTSKKKPATSTEVNMVEIAIPLVNGGSSDAGKRGRNKGNVMLNALTGGQDSGYGGLPPAMGRAMIENSVAKLVEQYVKDTAAAVVAEAVKKDKSTKRLIPVLISLDKRADKNETGTELINV